MEPDDPPETPTEPGAAADDESLERRLERLEAIVSALDSDALDLEQALALFEEGVTHVRVAEEILSKAELRVEELIGRQGEELRDLELGPDGDVG